MNSRVGAHTPATTELLVQLTLLVVLAVAFLYRPLIVLALVCGLVAWGSDPRRKYVFLVAGCLLLCVLNATKTVDGDLVNYVNMQNYLTGRPLLVLLDPNALIAISPTYRASEIGFYGTEWLLAQLFESTGASIAIAATLAIYVPTFIAIVMLGRVKGWNDRLTIIIALLAFLGAVNFNNTTHLIRQYVSASLLFLALVYFFGGRKWTAAAWAIIACSVHNGTAYVALCFVTLAALFPYGRPFWRRPWSSLFRLMLAIGVWGGSVVLLWMRELSGLLEQSDITIWRYLGTVLLFTVFLYFARARRMDRADYYLCLAFAVGLFISGCFFAMRLQVMALRYYVYLEWLYAPMVAGILCAIPRRHLSVYLASRWLVCCAALCVFVLRLYNSAWLYGPGSERVLSLNAREVMEYVGM